MGISIKPFYIIYGGKTNLVNLYQILTDAYSAKGSSTNHYTKRSHDLYLNFKNKVT